MKHLIALTVVALGLIYPKAEAKVICGINSSSNRDLTFDIPIVRQEIPIGGQRIFLLNDRTKKASTFESMSHIFNGENSARLALEFTKSTVVVISQASAGEYQIGVAQLTVVEATSPLRTIAIAHGTPEVNSPLSLVLPLKNLTVFCF
jgi:hypothetical protein